MYTEHKNAKIMKMVSNGGFSVKTDLNLIEIVFLDNSSNILQTELHDCCSHSKSCKSNLKFFDQSVLQNLRLLPKCDSTGKETQ